MQAKTIYKSFGALALGSALTFGASLPASALPQFQVTPSVLGGPAGTFTADHIDGGASSTVTYDGASTIMGQGYLTFSGFTLNAAQVFNTGLNSNYGLYATFMYQATLNSGSFGTANSNYTINSLDFNFYGYDASVNPRPVFTQANAATLTTASVTPGGNDRLIGVGSLLAGTINQNQLSGTTVTTVNSYQNTAFGSTFFTAPVPFYNIVFASLTNNTSGIQQNGNVLSINAASSSIDFNRVPEPGSLALVGIGLLGMFAASRRRKSN